MTVTIHRTSTEELNQRLNEVLAGVGLTERELHEWANKYMLTPEEREAWDEIRSIRFLLGDD